MPCNSDYMEPTGKERGIKRTASLIVHLFNKLGKRVPADIATRAADYYGADRQQHRTDDKVVDLLCRTVKQMSATDRERIIYDAHDATARDLASWYEAHLKADREREAAEAAAKAKTVARASAIKKLTPEERDALGVE